MPRASSATFFFLAILIMAILVLATLLNRPGIVTEVRSPVSHVRTEQRAMATAIEAYYAAHHAYPSERSFLTLTSDPAYLRKKGLSQLNFVEPGSKFLMGLTTPVAYMESLPL